MHLALFGRGDFGLAVAFVLWRRHLLDQKMLPQH
jgi:hypothetical protein